MMAEYKIYDFLESNDFEKESSTFTSSVISQVVKPDNIEGFVFSWFTDYDDPHIKKDILPLELQDKSSYFLVRNPNLFNFDSQTIILTENEINYINSTYFIAQLQNNYKKLFAELDAFHRHFEPLSKYSLIDYYETILHFLKDSRGLYKGNISNIYRLNLIKFKDLAENKLLKFQNEVQAKRKLLEYNSNPALSYDSSIFKSAQTFKHFKEYTMSNILEPYKDYSYLFQKMLAEGFIHRVKHSTFNDWLLENGYINKEDHHLIDSKVNFMSLKKSESYLRKANFENIFF